MSINYIITTNFGAKDSLPTNDSAKIIKGSEFTTEFNAIKSAFALAAPVNNATFTGTTTIPTAAVTTLNLGGVAVTATAAELNYVDGVTSNVQTQLNAKAPIDSPAFTGKIGAGSGDVADYDSDANDIVVGPHTGNNGITICSASTGSGRIFFADGTSAAQKYEGQIQYFHSTDTMQFRTAANIRANLNATGLDVTGNVETDTAFKLGDWEIKLDATDLVFNYNGTDVFKITTAGAAIALDDVTAFGTP